MNKKSRYIFYIIILTYSLSIFFEFFLDGIEPNESIIQSFVLYLPIILPILVHFIYYGIPDIRIKQDKYESVIVVLLLVALVIGFIYSKEDISNIIIIETLIFAPIFEEILYRGIIQSNLRKEYHTILVIFMVSLFFTIHHISVNSSLINFILIFNASIFFSSVFELTRFKGSSNILFLILLHSSYNMLIINLSILL